LFSLGDTLDEAYAKVESAKAFYNNIPANSDSDLYEAADACLWAAQKFLNYKVKQSKYNTL
jgi:hypothetical protein